MAGPSTALRVKDDGVERATATAKEEADPYGMTARKAKACAATTASTTASMGGIVGVGVRIPLIAKSAMNGAPGNAG